MEEKNPAGRLFKISAKLMLLIALVIILTGGTVFGLMYRAYVNNEVTLISDFLYKSVNAYVVEFDGDKIEPYVQNPAEDDRWREIYNLASDIRTTYNFTYVYVMGEKDPDTFVYVVDGGLNRTPTDDESKLGDAESKSEYGAEPNEAIQTGVSVATGAYDNGDWGRMISAFAPIRNSAGDIVAILGIDESYDQVAAEAAEKMRPVFISIAVAGGVLFVLVYLIAGLIIRRIIVRPLLHLKQTTEQLAGGSLDVLFTHRANDEMGQLADTFNGLTDTLRHLYTTVNQIKDWAVKGEFRSSMPEDTRIKGKYQEIIQGMNYILSAFTNHLDAVPLSLSLMDKEYGIVFMNRAGMDEHKIDQHSIKGKKCHECLAADKCQTAGCPGKDALASGTFNKAEMKTASAEIEVYDAPFRGENGEVIGFMEIVVDQTDAKKAERQASESARIAREQMQTARKQSDYQKAGVGMIMENIQKLAKGDLNIQLQDTPYDEDTKEIHDNLYHLEKSLVDSCAAIRSYIDELSEVLDELAHKNLDIGISREYVGDFSALKSSLNNIIDALNQVFEEIDSSAGQVQEAAAQVAGSASSLAHGASGQASAVEQISSTISEVAGQTQNNADNASKARGISGAAKNDALLGNQQMAEMVLAMEAIRESSKGISNIIKVIEDIAFQTNILALNAAVEAARAGVHGKGFAVVAEEVRTLAARSATAAKETTDMIDTSLLRVETGVKIADETAKALEKIVDGVTDTEGLVAAIAQDSRQQSAAITQINNGVEQISGVTQSNTATAEASASASEELAAQAQVLRGMVSEFTIKKSLYALKAEV